MYIGFAPYAEPQISLTIVLENAGGGGSNAAPLARKIMDFYFRDQQFNIGNNALIGDPVLPANHGDGTSDHGPGGISVLLLFII